MRLRVSGTLAKRWSYDIMLNERSIDLLYAVYECGCRQFTSEDLHGRNVTSIHSTPSFPSFCELTTCWPKRRLPLLTIAARPAASHVTTRSSVKTRVERCKRYRVLELMRNNCRSLLSVLGVISIKVRSRRWICERQSVPEAADAVGRAVYGSSQRAWLRTSERECTEAAGRTSRHRRPP